MVVGVGLSPTLFPVSRFYRALPSMLGTPHVKTGARAPELHAFARKDSNLRLRCAALCQLSYRFRGLDSNQHTRLQNGSMGRLRSCKGFPAGLTVRCVYSFRHHGKRRTLLHVLGNRAYAWQAGAKEPIMRFHEVRLYSSDFSCTCASVHRALLRFAYAQPTVYTAPAHDR